MEFHIPLTLESVEILKKKTKNFEKIFRGAKKTRLGEQLKNSDVILTSSEYLGICFRAFILAFVVLLLIFTSLFFFVKIAYFYFYGFILALVFSGFIFFKQLSYPRIYSLRKERDIEKNLIPAMQDMLVQLESGVPVFQIIVNIANSDYGFVSYEFKKAVNQMNSGISQIEALENLIKRNSSAYFKRVLWQLSNGLKSGSDMSIVIKDSIDNLNKEQAIQIQSYGSKLNPIVMFFMLMTVILPSLGITFLTLISSMLNLSSTLVKMMFLGIFVFIVLIQIMFLGMIRSRRPSLI